MALLFFYCLNYVTLESDRFLQCGWAITKQLQYVKESITTTTVYSQQMKRYSMSKDSNGTATSSEFCWLFTRQLSTKSCHNSTNFNHCRTVEIKSTISILGLRQVYHCCLTNNIRLVQALLKKLLEQCNVLWRWSMSYLMITSYDLNAKTDNSKIIESISLKNNS